MHQPLKRFTQCGSLTMLFAVFIILFGVSSTALTTFGKSNSQNVATPPPIKAKDCVTQADCIAMRDTSCVRDYPYQQLRCLCGDNKPPRNGVCEAKFKGLRHICTDSKQCDEGMICSKENATKTTSLGFRNGNSASNSYLQCLCDEDIGYQESVNLNYCNGAIQMVTGVLVPLIALLIGSVVARRPMFRHFC